MKTRYEAVLSIAQDELDLRCRLVPETEDFQYLILLAVAKEYGVDPKDLKIWGL